MHNVWTIARHEYSVHVRRTGFIIVTLLVPALGILGLLLMTFLGGQIPAFLEKQFSPGGQQIGIVDEMGAFTPLLPGYETRYWSFADEQAGRQAIQAGQISALMVIPADYIQTGDVQVISKEGGLAAVSLDGSSARKFFIDHLLQGKLDPELRQRVADPVNPVLVSLEAEGEPSGGALNTFLGIMVPYFLVILLVITIFVTSGYLLRGVSEEKTNRVIEILLSSVSAYELLAGKVIGLGALGLTQVIVWLGSVIALGSISSSLIGLSIPLISRTEVFALAIVYYALGFLMFAVLMGSVGALGTTMQESQQMAGMFSFLAAAPLFFAGFIFTNPNMLLIRILSWFPLTAPTSMIIRLPMSEVPVIDIVISIVGLLITIPLILWMGSKVFRMGLLMYGKRPTLAQVWKTMRET